MAQEMLMDGAAHMRRLTRHERALEVLRHAETQVGVRPPALAERPRPGPGPATRAESPRRAGPTAPRGTGNGQAGAPQEGWLPIPAPFAPVIGGLPRGSAVQIDGSASLLLSFAAAATAGPERREAWVAVVGMPDLCLAAAAEAGVDLDRVVIVPDPGERAATVVAAAIDGFEVVIIGPAVRLREREQRSLLHRVRGRAGLLFVTDPWPGTTLTVRATARTWQGIEQGYGLLEGQEIQVRVIGRGRVAVDHSMRVRLGGQGAKPSTRAPESSDPSESSGLFGPPGSSGSPGLLELPVPSELPGLSRPGLARVG